MTHQYSFKKNDEYHTPEYAVIPIVDFLKKDSIVWCPFDTGESNFVKVLTEKGFTVIHSHINDGKDFFCVDVPDCDYIISNPPYSCRDKVFERLYDIGKPFAMLINFQGIFDSKKRFNLFKNNKVEMLWLSPRVSFFTETGEKTSPPFQSGYLCSGILTKQLEFSDIKR